MTPTPETPAGGLTEDEHEALIEAIQDGDERTWVDALVAKRVAAAVVQVRAEDRARIEAALAGIERLPLVKQVAVSDVAYVTVSIAAEQVRANAVDVLRAALTATEDGDH